MRLSEGYNPQPRMSLPLPRPVGVASDAERHVLEHAEPVEPRALAARLADRMPQGVRIQGAAKLPSRVGTAPRKAEYEVALNGLDPRAVAAKAAGLMRFEPIHYDRFVHKESKHLRIDLRPYIESIRVDENWAHFTLYVTGGGSVRPAEICDLLGIGGQHVNHRIRRRKVLWH